MVYRVYVEKKEGLDNEARALLGEARSLLGVEGLEAVRLYNRYDAEGLSADLFEYAKNTVFAEPQLDHVSDEMTAEGATVFAVEYLPGQYDQRADSAAQCIQIISQQERPIIRTAKVYALYGNLTADELAAIKKHVINPVESREASLELPATLAVEHTVPAPVATIDGFTAMDRDALSDLLDNMGLAMDVDDLCFLQAYFRDEEHRDPTVTEIRVVDTYWSDHCRHTTFSTHFDNGICGRSIWGSDHDPIGCRDHFPGCGDDCSAHCGRSGRTGGIPSHWYRCGSHLSLFGACHPRPLWQGAFPGSGSGPNGWCQYRQYSYASDIWCGSPIC